MHADEWSNMTVGRIKDRARDNAHGGNGNGYCARLQVNRLEADAVIGDALSNNPCYERVKMDTTMRKGSHFSCRCT